MEPQDIFSGRSLSFDKGIAETCGVNAAIIFNHITYWIEHNLENPQVQKEGKVWMYETIKKMSSYLRFLTEKEVRNAVDKLEEAGLIIKANFNKNPLTKTTWYSLPDALFQKMFTKRPYGQMQLPDGADVYKEEDVITKTDKLRNNGDCGNVHNSRSSTKQAKNVAQMSTVKTKASPIPEDPERKVHAKREIPKFLSDRFKKLLSEKDMQMLANQFSDSELNVAIEMAKDYHKKGNKFVNFAAFLTGCAKKHRNKVKSAQIERS